MKRFSFLLLIALAPLGHAAEVTLTLPAETATLKPGKGVELAQANCTACHSADYPRMQPTMPRKFWEASVKKMREKFGAPIAEESVPALVDYLTAAYGAEAK
jgi:mono/diheme cytochrome c family protein